MDDDKKMISEKAENDFKNKVFDIFSERIPGTHRDEDGMLVVPIRIPRRKKDSRRNSDV